MIFAEENNQIVEELKDAEKKPVVVVTGFGPFRTFNINPSWVVVNELKNLRKNEDFNLIIHELPVEYSTVENVVPKLWSQYKPKLMLHCGVAENATTLVLETRAHNSNYVKPDVCGKLPNENCCFKCGENCLISKLQMDIVSEEVNNSNANVLAAVSKNAGRYLCEFTYYTSLNINSACTAFIHIPPLNSPYSSQQMAMGIYTAIKAMLKQLD